MRTSLQITHFGRPEVLKLVEEPSPNLHADCVRIRVTATGVNFADLMMRSGLYPEAPKPPFIPGYEIAGTITEVGAAVQSVHPGDRVLAGCRFGGYTNEIVLPEILVRKIPGKLTDIEAAAIPVNFLTAWIALQDFARIRKGDKVLIQSAAGGVGIAAIQIAAQSGAKVTGLVSSLSKAEKIKALGADEILTYEQWENAEDEEAGGFEVILDSTGGKSLKRSFRRLASGGRVVTFGVSSLVSGPKRSVFSLLNLLSDTSFFTPFKLMMENKGVFGLNLLKLMDELKGNKPHLITHALDEILERFQDKSFQVIVGKTFPMAQGAAAHTLLQSRTNIGKIVLIPPRNEDLT